GRISSAAGAPCPRSPSTGRRSGRFAQRSGRRVSRSHRRGSGPSGPWRTERVSRGSFAASRASRTGRGRAGPTPGFRANGRCTASSAGAGAPGRRSSGGWSEGWLASGGPRGGGRWRQHREECQAGTVLLGRADGRERLLGEPHVRAERPSRDDPAAAQGEERPLGELPLAKRHAQIGLEELEGRLRRGEEELV